MAETSCHTRSTRRQPVGRWLIVILLTVIATCLLIELGAAAPAAHGQVGAAGSQDVLVVAGQVASGVYGLYLVDLKQKTICVYQFVPHARKKRLEFVAARTFVYDVMLDDWNNADPLPREVKMIVDKQQRLKDTETGPGNDQVNEPKAQGTHVTTGTPPEATLRDHPPINGRPSTDTWENTKNPF